MIRVCAIDGGGAKGIIPLTVLREIEQKTGEPFYRLFDLVVGSSIGAILAGLLAANCLPADSFLYSLKKDLPTIFKKRLRVPIFQPKYDRRKAEQFILSYLQNNYTMSQCLTKFMCTSVSTSDGRTHFFKSWENKDGKLNLTEAITRSFAAPLFFGGLIDKKEKTMWLDGGIGLHNCPLDKTYIEVLRQKWENEQVHILSLGCGSSNYSVPFDKVKRFFNIRQILFYNNPVEGGLAREQSTQEQVSSFKDIVKSHPNMTFQRLDILDMPKKENGLDKVKYINRYERYGIELSRKIDYNLLFER